MTDPDLKTDSSNPLSLELAIVETGIQSSDHKPQTIKTHVPKSIDKVATQQGQNVQEKKEKGNSVKVIKNESIELEPTVKIDETNAPKNEDSSPLNTDQNDEKLENGWQEILESLRYTKGQKFNLKALLVTCTTRKLENDSIVLGFSHPSHRERMEHELTIPESRKTLSDAFTKIMNKQYELAVEKDNVSLRENKTNDELQSPLIRAAQSMGAQVIGQSDKRDLDN